MWLLDASSYVLRETSTSSHITYAVLSHVWEHSWEEVTFQEMKSISEAELPEVDEVKVTSKLGYHKIRMACRQTKEDGYDYLWVDTCCIDKSNLSELSEAINSMWQIYSDAAICYAFLNDVDGVCPVLADPEDTFAITAQPRSRTPWYLLFRNSIWFQRGWTLQELIAPQEVKFYSKDWNFLGAKSDLVRTLWDITGIDPLVLQDRASLSRFVAARKFSWAAHRRTTKIEDRTYSLLGLFGVNMPLLYGEGERAFIRLQETLTRTSTDHSIFAWDWDAKEPEEPSDLVFATSPDQFYPWGRRMVRNLKLEEDLPFQITNQGIAFDSLGFVPQMQFAGLEAAGVLLNCHLQDNVYGRIHLLLEPLDEQRGEYYVARRPFIVSRLVFTPSSAVPKRVILRRHRTIFDGDVSSQNPPVMPPRIKLMGDPRVRFVAAWPPQLWNKLSMVFCLPFERIHPQTMQGCALLRGESSEKLALVAISFATTRTPAIHNPFGFRVVVSTETLDLEEVLVAAEKNGEKLDYSRNAHVRRLLKDLKNALDGDPASKTAATLDDQLMCKARDPNNEHLSVQVTSEHIINGDIVYHLVVKGL